LRARHRRLRPLRHPRQPAPLLRGRSPLDRARRDRALADEGKLKRSDVAKAIKLDVEKANPMSV
jgi:hypothetical protein